MRWHWPGAVLPLDEHSLRWSANCGKIDLASAAEATAEDPASVYDTALKSLALVKATDLQGTNGSPGSQSGPWSAASPTLSFGVGLSTSYSSVAYQSRFRMLLTCF